MWVKACAADGSRALSSAQMQGCALKGARGGGGGAGGHLEHGGELAHRYERVVVAVAQAEDQLELVPRLAARHERKTADKQQTVDRVPRALGRSCKHGAGAREQARKGGAISWEAVAWRGSGTRRITS